MSNERVHYHRVVRAFVLGMDAKFLHAHRPRKEFLNASISLEIEKTFKIGYTGNLPPVA